jgi:hypothetical protein
MGTSSGILASLEALAAQYELVAIYVFCSRATEIAAWVGCKDISPEFPNSDIDIGILPTFGRRLSAKERGEKEQRRMILNGEAH